MAQLGKNDPKAELWFEDREWESFEADLHPLDDALVALAQKYGMRLMQRAPKGLPGRTLRRRKGFRVYSISISLEPRYLEDETRITWEIFDSWMRDVAGFFRKAESFRRLSAELTGNALVAAGIAAVDAALKQNLQN